MSTVIVLTPIIIANWPAIVAVVSAAVGTLGFSAVQEDANRNIPGYGNDGEESRSTIARFSPGRLAGRGNRRRARGIAGRFHPRCSRQSCGCCMEGKGYSKADLRNIGQELVDRVTQQYVYHRVMTEMKQRNMHVVSEEVAEDRTVKFASAIGKGSAYGQKNWKSKSARRGK